ncbi:hypothetical protein ScalyP_jg6250 [Parmales sp. scaly parma]|nr:hypothetical protein ScalyP_jg6250 [Parmales sp. scaly parma]
MCNRRESERSVLKLAYKVRATANQRPEIHTHEYDNSNGDNHQSESKNKSKASMVGSFGGGRQMGMTGTMINDFRCEVERGTGRPTTAGSRLSSAIKYGGGVRNRPSTANAGVLRSDSELVSMVKDFNTTNSVNNLTVLSESLGRSGIPVRTIMVPPPKLPPGESEPCDIKFYMTHLHKLRMGYLTGEGSREAFMDRPHTSNGRVDKPVWKPQSQGPGWRMIRVEKKQDRRQRQ